MANCCYRAEDSWDKEMNKYYNLLMKSKSIPKEEKEKLKEAQIKWLAYRDSEILYSNTHYNNYQGTMWISVAAQRTAEIVKDRTLALKIYYDELPFSK